MIRSARTNLIGVVLFQATVALLLFSPVLVLGENFSHSDRFNHVWVEQFSRQVLSGDIYPRWLNASFGGMGAPSFYFYPPAFFYVAAAIHAISLGAITAQYQISIAGALISLASGLSMFALLRRFVDRRWSLIGGAVYQLAPYHVADFYVRGALAEYTAYV